jgi:hypothetical protein
MTAIDAAPPFGASAFGHEANGEFRPKADLANTELEGREQALQAMLERSEEMVRRASVSAVAAAVAKPTVVCSSMTVAPLVASVVRAGTGVVEPTHPTLRSSPVADP